MSGVSSGAIPAVALTALRCQGPPEYLTEFPKRPWRVLFRHVEAQRIVLPSCHQHGKIRSKDVTRDMSRQCYHCLQRMQTFHPRNKT
jgi:hypothetical protein